MKRFLPEGRLTGDGERRTLFRTPAAVAEAAAAREIVEARASVCDASHNLVVDLGCMKGVIPREEGAIGIADGRVRDIALISRVNKPVCFVITGVRTDRKGELYAVLSRRLAQEACQRDYIDGLRPGDVIGARVTHLENFGAFCDIGCGISALLPIDAISVSRIAHPADRFSVGDDIRAVVRGSDAAGRISLTHKELLGTWEENAALFSQGETVSGIVRSVEDYGIFVELLPNLAGLAEPRPGVRPGQQASVYIKSLLPDKMKVKLILIDAFDADYASPPIRYFYEGSHLDAWQYSPPGCRKQVQTVFLETAAV